MMKIMDAATLKQLLLQDKAVVIDVREQDEYDAVHLAGAHLIPLGEVSNHPLPPVAGRKLVLHCRAGKRSALACEALLASNPSLEVYNLEGGILAWIARGYAVEGTEAD